MESGRFCTVQIIRGLVQCGCADAIAEPLKPFVAHILKTGAVPAVGAIKKSFLKFVQRGTDIGGVNFIAFGLECGKDAIIPDAKATRIMGGRGISICSDWDSYKEFEAWALEHGYAEGLTIERRDVNGNYCPENCCWIPRCEQAKNTRRTLNNRKREDTV